ncbi:hypothetical protein [Acinetobacter sp. MD2(2019)]|uniref:hypothetical protein n=1 Tax=Acinetobacter sp. MD2(2019) TaxID=2605273 RepID=UPI002D1F5FF3|nr:hypothetical protein [Acinetobacter sp. MD2(2019)]MEB3752994.1 hypothetical protein [Acinetobacter sp. MD2(2019)]
MQTLITHFSQYIRQIYEKTSGFIEEEREFTVTEAFLNSTLQRYVTDNVGLLKDLHADLHDDWMRLYATIQIQGIYAEVYVDLKLLQMQLNKQSQLLVFEQISQTQIVESKIQGAIKNWAVHAALFFYQKILKQDPLGKILSHFNIVTVKDDLLFLDLSRWLGTESIVAMLSKVQVNQAEVQENKLIVFGNLNLEAVLMRSMVSEEDIKEETIDVTLESKKTS